ncbi:MAG: hypothetical protein ACOY9J_13220 [Pseudomonadota bacterium]
MSKTKTEPTSFSACLEGMTHDLGELSYTVAPAAELHVELEKARAQLGAIGPIEELDLADLPQNIEDVDDPAMYSYRCALIYLCAAEAIAQHNGDSAWYCLLKCRGYFGEAHVSAIQRSGLESAQRRGSQSRKNKLDAAKAHAAQLLRDRAKGRSEHKPEPLPQWQDPSEAAADIKAAFARYIQERSIALKASQFQARLEYWIRSNDQVRAAFESYCDQGYLIRSRRRKEKKAALDHWLRLDTT